MRLLSAAYSAAKTADPSVTVITAGLSPTGVTDGHSADDATYLQWLYDAGTPGSLPNFAHASFYLRRIEQLRDVMVNNGEVDKRVWLLEFGWTSDTRTG